MIQISEARKKLLLLWLIFTALLLVFFLLQFLNGKYAGMETTAWAWYFLQILPGLALLLVAELLNLNRGKIIVRWAFWAILALAGLFLMAVLVSLAGISGGSSGKNLSDAFADSYFFLGVLQAVVLAAFGVLFFKKEIIFPPKKKQLLEHAQTLLDTAQKSGELDRCRAIELFFADDLPAMLDFLEEKLRAKNPKHGRLNDLFLLKNQLTRVRRDAGFGVSTEADAGLNYNRICLTALELVGEI